MTDWQDDAACRSGYPQDWWFMEGMFEYGQTICRSCPVWKECLAQAITDDECFGVWGGLTPEERGHEKWRLSKTAKAARARRQARETA